LKHECIVKMITIFVDNLQFTFVFILLKQLIFLLHDQIVSYSFWIM